MNKDYFIDTLSQEEFKFFSLEKVESHYHINLKILPISLRILLENILRNSNKIEDFEKVLFKLMERKKEGKIEVPYFPGRVILQDYTGIPLLVDLASLREAAVEYDIDPLKINPIVPTSLVIDHSLHAYYSGVPDAIGQNMKIEFQRNMERYKFIKWGQNAFSNFKVIPPGNGIVHQINIEYLAEGVLQKAGVLFPDTVIGTDSHTTMANGLGILSWGVGGIEAESVMLGQPIQTNIPEVIGVELFGKLKPGITSTDIVLTLTEYFRKIGVVGKYLEFFGEGVSLLSVPDRATIANMVPEFGATIALFPVDDQTLSYYEITGRSRERVGLIKDYYLRQGLWGKQAEIVFDQVLQFDLSTVEATVAGPSRPQDKIILSDLKKKYRNIVGEKKLGQKNIANKSPVNDGDILVAAITSCTNTSNPALLLAAGLLAKKAVEKGLSVSKTMKTMLAPGSKVVTQYLLDSGLLPYLEKLNFHVVGYGCAACVGNIGRFDETVEDYLREGDVYATAVLSGNRNFEARVHPYIRGNFLMSPPLVVAFALAGNIDVDLTTDPVGFDTKGVPVYLCEIWPEPHEIQEMIQKHIKPEVFKAVYQNLENSFWNNIPVKKTINYDWDKASMYIAKAPFVSDDNPVIQDVFSARALLILGDSITTDHISPAGRILPESDAGRYLSESGVLEKDFNTFGSRRGHHEIMLRGAFSNPKLKNFLSDTDGPYTKIYPEGSSVSIFKASENYITQKVPTFIFAGKEYGSGSSRDWAAKATKLLGVRAVIAESFERIHRSNLIGMGVLPCVLPSGYSIEKLSLDGSESFDLLNVKEALLNGESAVLIIRNPQKVELKIPISIFIETETEMAYLKNGGLMPYLLKNEMF